MKLGVDSRMMVGKWQYRGIGRYTADLLKPLDTNNIIAFLPDGLEIKQFKCISKGISFFPIWEQFILPKLVAKEKLTNMLYPCITSPLIKSKKVKNIIVVYDLIFMEPFSKLPASHSLYNNLGRLYRKFLAPRTYKSSETTLLSISEYSKQQVHERFGIPLKNIHVIPCSLTTDWFQEGNRIDSSDKEKYLITVSGDAPSKNLKNTIAAFKKAIEETKLNDFKLRIVGVAKLKRVEYQKTINDLDIKDKVIFEDFVQLKDLKKLYRKAWASLTLSLYEGFGIPVIEAMACGTPVICSNTTSLPEVAGGAAILVDPYDINKMASAISQILTASAEDRNKISENGLLNANKYSEENVALQIKEFWKFFL